MTRWDVHIALDALGDTIHWSLSDPALLELRRALEAGELGRARIVRIEPYLDNGLTAEAA